MSILMHGGNLKDIALSHGIDIENLVDFSSNINPLGPPQGLLEYLNSNINELLLLPEYDSGTCIGFISGLMGIDKDRVVAGNGTTEFIHRLPETLKPNKVLIVGPTYSDYEKACKIRNIDVEYLFLEKDTQFEPDFNLLEQKIKDFDLVFICNPNNPTGTVFEKDYLKDFCKSNKNTTFVIDETYLPFERSFLNKTMAFEDENNLFVLLSFSKIFTLPGLRLGFMVMPSYVNKKIYDLPWKVNSVSAGVCSYLTENSHIVRTFLESTLDFIDEEKKGFFSSRIINENLEPINRNNIYTLCRIRNRNLDSSKIFDFFLKKGMVIRDCYNIKGLGLDYIRFSLKKEKDNQKLLNTMQDFFN